MQPPQLPFTATALLAPMEGVTESCFRDLVLDRNRPEALGGVFTEFVRIVDDPISAKTLRAHMGPRRHGAPVGLQMMGRNEACLAETARTAEAVGAPLVDLNFGCPAKGALRTCAGAALLDDPARMERLIRACVDAVESVPVTAKIRAGGCDDSRLEEIATAVEAGGAALLTVHCRTREEGYSGDGDWERLRRAVAAVSIPVCGNGGVDDHADLARLIEHTGCDYVMVGRAALRDPWIFEGRSVDRAEAARFLLDYGLLLADRKRAGRGRVVGRLKQLIRRWTAGGLFDDSRDWWMAQGDPQTMLDELARCAKVEPRPIRRSRRPSDRTGSPDPSVPGTLRSPRRPERPSA